MELTKNHINTVCRLGSGAKACKFLTLRSGGWMCAKGTDIEMILRMRTDMRAQGDNCSGPPNFETEPV